MISNEPGGGAGNIEEQTKIATFTDNIGAAALYASNIMQRKLTKSELWTLSPRVPLQGVATDRFGKAAMQRRASWRGSA